MSHRWVSGVGTVVATYATKPEGASATVDVIGSHAVVVSTSNLSFAAVVGEARHHGVATVARSAGRNGEICSPDTEMNKDLHSRWVERMSEG